MSFIGNTPTSQSFISGTDYFNGTGSQTAFTLTRAVNSINDIEVVINNVVQQPNTAYTILGNVVTFTSAPSAGTANIYVRYLSTTTQTITPGQGTVGYNQLTADVQNDLGISFKNRIINGAMVIDQRNAGASVTPATSAYTLDRWNAQMIAASKFSVQQSSTAPSGFVKSLLATSTSAYSVSSGDYFRLDQWIEGNNTADFGWGTASAKTITLSFSVRSSLTGTFGGVIANNSFNRCYPFSYTISSANTWTSVSITIPGDTAGTWLTDNGIGVRVSFSLGAGSTYSGTAGAWTGSTITQPTGSTSVVGTSGATFYLTGVQLEVGTSSTAFDTRSYGTELALCQRYLPAYNATSNVDILGSGYVASASVAIGTISFPVTARVSPTGISISSGTVLNFDSANGFASTSVILNVASSSSASIQINSSGMTAGHGGRIRFNAIPAQLLFTGCEL